MLQCGQFLTYDKQVIRDYHWMDEDDNYGAALFHAVCNSSRVKCEQQIITKRINSLIGAECIISYELKGTLDGQPMVMHIDCENKTAWACVTDNAVNFDIFLAMTR